jgi:hypothetical protein
MSKYSSLLSVTCSKNMGLVSTGVLFVALLYYFYSSTQFYFSNYLLPPTAIAKAAAKTVNTNTNRLVEVALVPPLPVPLLPVPPPGLVQVALVPPPHICVSFGCACSLQFLTFVPKLRCPVHTANNGNLGIPLPARTLVVGAGRVDSYSVV